MRTLRQPESEHASPERLIVKGAAASDVSSTASAVAVHLTPGTPERPSGEIAAGLGGLAAMPKAARAGSKLDPARIRAAVVVELVRTTVLAIFGSAALFAMLGGGLLVWRAHADAAPAALAGSGVLLAGLLFLVFWGTWRAGRLGPTPPAKSSPNRRSAETAAPDRLPWLPYVLAALFLATAVASGVAALLRLAGLRGGERTVGAFLWTGCCAVAALAVVLRWRSFFAALSQTMRGRGGAETRPLLSVRSKLLGGFGWLLLWGTALALLKQLLLGLLGERGGPLFWRGLWIMLPVQVVAAGGVVALAVVGLAWPVRDLLNRAAAVVGQTAGGRGELQRPIVLGVSAPTEVIELQRLFDQLRRLLLARLRSSTEQNLQLEAEVARRSAELSRRNTELSDALTRLESAREELLRAEKLATVGRIAAGITSEIDAPVARMTDCCRQLNRAAQALLAEPHGDDAPAERAAAPRLISQSLAALDSLTDSAKRVRDIVRAMRVYVRPGETQAGRCDVHDVLDDVRQLFGEPFRHVIKIQRDSSGATSASQVLTVRSDLALLLTSWLGRVEPRLRERPDAHVVVRTRLLTVPRPAVPPSVPPHMSPPGVDSSFAPAGSVAPSLMTVCELTLRDNGRPLTAAEQIEPLGPELLRRLGARAWVSLSSGPPGSLATDCAPGDPGSNTVAEETVLTVHLPVAAPILPQAR